MEYPSENLCNALSKSLQYGNRIANNVAKEFLVYVMMKNRDLFLQLTSDLLSEPENPMTLLRTKFLANPSVPQSCTKIFYKILQKNSYREQDEVLECISYISEHCDSNLNLAFWKRCPWIKDITYDERSRMYTVHTYRDSFTFLPISHMYQNELDLIRMTARKQKSSSHATTLANGYNIDDLENFDYNCHFVSYEFSKLHPEFYAVTAICPYVFLIHIGFIATIFLMMILM